MTEIFWEVTSLVTFGRADLFRFEAAWVVDSRSRFKTDAVGI